MTTKLLLLSVIVFFVAHTYSAPAVVENYGVSGVDGADRIKRSAKPTISIYIPYGYGYGPFEHLFSGTCFSHAVCGLTGGCYCSTGNSGYRGSCNF